MVKKEGLSFENKLFTILISVILSFVLFELFLQIISLVYYFYNIRKQSVVFNGFNSDKKDYYTILCIGSSNTAGEKFPDFKTLDYSYPTLLFRLLNKEGEKIKYRVINEGIPGATTFTLLVNLEKNIKKYKPDLIICMIGGNDTFFTGNYNFKFIEFFKVLKTFRLIFDGGYKLFEYFNNRINPFGTASFKNSEYYIDRIGHYPAIFEPWNFLKTFNLKFSKEIKTSIWHLKNGRIKDAIEWANRAVEKEKKIVCQLYLAEIYSQISEYEKAIEIYNEVVKRNSNSLIYLKLAKQYELLGKFNKAEEVYEMLLKEYKNDINVLFCVIPFYQELLSIAEENKENYKEEYLESLENSIISLCKEVIKREPNNLLGYLLLGKHYNHKGELSFAIEYLKKAYLLENKRSYKGYFIYTEQPARYLADSYVDIGQVDEAISLLKNLLKYKNPAIYRHLANIYKKMENHKEAEFLFKKANEIENNYMSDTFGKNYRKIVEIVLSKGIKIIAMENPNKSIDNLKRILSDINGVILVSNEHNFKEALKKEGYEKYFEDLSAGEYGHCTKEGNMLIATNLLPVILKELR